MKMCTIKLGCFLALPSNYISQAYGQNNKSFFCCRLDCLLNSFGDFAVFPPPQSRSVRPLWALPSPDADLA